MKGAGTGFREASDGMATAVIAEGDGE